jgi:hypothetical protein
MHSPRRHRRGDAALRRGFNGGTLRLPGTAYAVPAGHALAAPHLWDAALRRGSNGGMLRLPGTAQTAPAGHALAARLQQRNATTTRHCTRGVGQVMHSPPQTRRRYSAPRLQRRDATTTRHCSRDAGRSCTRRPAKDATTPRCAAAQTMLRPPGTAHAALAGHSLAAPPKTRRRRSALLLQRRDETATRHCSRGAGKTRRRRSAPRRQRRDAMTTRHSSRGAGRSLTRRAAKDAATPFCAAAPTAG